MTRIAFRLVVLGRAKKWERVVSSRYGGIQQHHVKHSHPNKFGQNVMLVSALRMNLRCSTAWRPIMVTCYSDQSCHAACAFLATTFDPNLNGRFEVISAIVGTGGRSVYLLSVSTLCVQCRMKFLPQGSLSCTSRLATTERPRPIAYR